MNKLSEYGNYVASLAFGVILVVLIRNNEPPIYMVMITFVWLGPLVRVGYLSNQLKALKSSMVQPYGK
ncbi:hypothetical protein MnBA_40470 [Marinobacterium sp. BA1]